MRSLQLDALDKKKELVEKVLKLSPKGKLTPKLKMKSVYSENPADLWYFTHT